MAKAKINEKITTTHKLNIECTLNSDKLKEGVLIGEVEDEGEKDLSNCINKFNGKYVTITITEKTEEELSEE